MKKFLKQVFCTWIGWLGIGAFLTIIAAILFNFVPEYSVGDSILNAVFGAGLLVLVGIFVIAFSIMIWGYLKKA